MKDFFISYNKKDRAWAEWIAWHLEEAGYTTVLQDWDFRPGSNFVLKMQQATIEAQRIIAVLSPDYLNALYTQPEWAAAFAQDPTGDKGTLLPIRVRECGLKGLLAPIIYIDLVGLEESRAKDNLLTGVKGGRGKPELPPAFPREDHQLRGEQPPFPGSEYRRGFYQMLADWFGNSILIHRLQGRLALAPKSITNAIEVLFIGLLVGLTVRYVVVIAYGSQMSFGQFLGGGFALFGNVLLFTIILYAFLYIFRARPDLRVVLTLSLYTFSAVIPLMMVLSVEQQNEAIRLFIRNRDPGLPYLHAATINLLFPEQATFFAVARNWIFFLLEATVIVWYIPYHLRRLLIESSSVNFTKIKITVALMLAWLTHSLCVHFYFVRAYWTLMSRTL
jgi:hypothetical protein